MEHILTTPEELRSLISECLKQERQNISHAPEPKLDTEYITRKQTAEILGISLPTLGLWSKTGVIPAYRIASRVRYKREEVMNSVSKVQITKYGRKGQ